MPLVDSTYRAPRWLPGGHLQTIWPARLVPLPEVAYRRERWPTPDGDFIDVDFALPQPADEGVPLLALFHGLEGDSGSHYARVTMRHFADLGWRAMVVHFRGCSGEPNLMLRAYHSGDSEEGDWVLRTIGRRWPSARLHAVGVSLGGNMLAKWLGERGEDARLVTAAASIGSPLDLVAGGHAIGRGFNRLYTRMFLASLKAKARDKAERFGYAIDTEVLRRARDLYDFDNLFTAPVHGFRDTLDYWTRASAKPLLGNVRVPHLVLNARNDPFVPAESLPQPREVSAAVTLEQPKEGGHIGFAGGRFPGHLRFLPERLERFFRDGR